MWSWLTAFEYRRCSRFDSYYTNPRIMFLQRTGYSADCTSRPDSCHEDIDLSVRIGPHFFAGRTFMYGSVRRIIKLLKNNGTGRSIAQCLGFGNGARHTFGTRCQHNFRSKCFQQVTTFQTHGFGHGQHQPIPFDGSYHGKANTGISAGRFNQGCTGFQHTPFLGIFNHSQCRTCLDTARRIKHFKFCHKRARQTMQTAVC